jgi:hypothetical protein
MSFESASAVVPVVAVSLPLEIAVDWAADSAGVEHWQVARKVKVSPQQPVVTALLLTGLAAESLEEGLVSAPAAVKLMKALKALPGWLTKLVSDDL